MYIDGTLRSFLLESGIMDQLLREFVATIFLESNHLLLIPYQGSNSYTLFFTFAYGVGFQDFGVEPPRGVHVIYNTGLTTFNNNGEQMLMSELIRVTGHELGHNWGSHHDPSGDPNCQDRWLMNEFAQDGSEGTHMVRVCDFYH